MTLTFDNAYVLDVLDVAFNRSIQKGILTPQIAELLKEQEKKQPYHRRQCASHNLWKSLV